MLGCGCFVMTWAELSVFLGFSCPAPHFISLQPSPCF